MLPDALVAVTVGLAEPGSPPLMEDAIGRSFKLIEGAVLDSISSTGTGTAIISLDEATARLIGDRFEVKPSVSGYQLLGERADENTG
jgi:hypothetical protein